ncbi:MAG: histidinol dehydrogenase [Pseudomonadota bacterium]|nr:histidinol dehydrogenase [Pseudomonadota bacterium]
MKILDWNSLDEGGRRAVLARPKQRTDPRLQAAVAGIMAEVREGGWDGLCDAARRIDGAEPRLVEVAPVAAAARQSLSSDQIAAMDIAARNIRTFHEAARPRDVDVETAPGLRVRKLWRPIDRVGLYVPGGATPLFSTLLMLAIPARVAGVPDIVTVTPPQADGSLSPVIALAAELCGLDAVWTVGGAQAVAALAFGAGPIARVDKICGPGNAWVAEAKRRAAGAPGGVAIDMPAGPSELMVIADESADPRQVAADLLSQAEHDPAAQVLLVTASKALTAQVVAEVEAQTPRLPRSAVARAALGTARVILTGNIAEAVEIANLYAPEHLSLSVADAEARVPQVRNAGAVFAGSMAAETFGDYLAGSSHVLPTDGAARAWSGVGVDSFMKAISVQSVTAEAARRMAPAAALLARMEGLEAHALAADCRLESVA